MGVAAAVVAARVGRSRGAVVQFIDKVVFVLLQLKFQQSRVCTGSSSTECWTFRLCSERGTHGYVWTVYEMACFLFHVQGVYPQCKLCRRLFLRRLPCDQQRQVPTVQRFESSCPRFSSSSEW